MKHTVLAVDDERSFHMLLDRMIGEEFDVLHAYDAQEAIDKLAEEAIHLVLCDFQMPGIDGLQFLESVQIDQKKKDIPVLMVTGYESDEIERKAYDLGAADFISKTEIADDSEKLLERIRLKLISDIDLPKLDEELESQKKRVINRVLQVALKRDFDALSDVVVECLNESFNTEIVSVWAIDREQPRLLSSNFNDETFSLSAEGLMQDLGYKKALEQGKPYLNNYCMDNESHAIKELCKKRNLSAQVGAPLFGITEKNLLMQDLDVSPDVDVYAYVLLLRSELFSSREFELLSDLCVRIGAIMWRLHQQEQVQ